MEELEDVANAVSKTVLEFRRPAAGITRSRVLLFEKEMADLKAAVWLAQEVVSAC